MQLYICAVDLRIARVHKKRNGGYMTDCQTLGAMMLTYNVTTNKGRGGAVQIHVQCVSVSMHESCMMAGKDKKEVVLARILMTMLLVGRAGRKYERAGARNATN